MTPVKQRQLLATGESGLLFFNIESIAASQASFLSALSSWRKSAPTDPAALAALLQQQNEFFVMHSQYLSNFPTAESLLSRLIQEKPDLAELDQEVQVLAQVKNPCYGILALIGLPVRYLVLWWLQLSELRQLFSLAHQDVQKLLQASQLLKDSVDQIRFQKSLENSLWPLVELAQNVARLPVESLLKPHRSFISQREIQLAGIKGFHAVSCVVLNDCYAFIAKDTGKMPTFLGKLSLKHATLSKSSEVDAEAELEAEEDCFNCDKTRKWLKLSTGVQTVFFTVPSEIEQLNWLDMFKAQQSKIRRTVLRTQKPAGPGSRSSAQYAVCSEIETDVADFFLVCLVLYHWEGAESPWLVETPRHRPVLFGCWTQSPVLGQRLSFLAFL